MKVVIVTGVALAVAIFGSAAAREAGGKVPAFPVQTSCRAAQKFSDANSKDKDYESCMRDEARAKDELAKRWSSFKAVDKKQCIEEGPDPSYVEMLTCLEMDTSKLIGDTRVPQIGGPVAPGLPPQQGR